MAGSDRAEPFVVRHADVRAHLCGGTRMGAAVSRALDAALDRFVYDTSSRDWLTDARADLRVLRAKADLADDLAEALRAAHDPERWSEFLTMQVEDLLARLDEVTA